MVKIQRRWDYVPYAQTCKSSYTKALKRLMKKNNPYAFIQMAHEHKSGDRVLLSDRKALEITFVRLRLVVTMAMHLRRLDIIFSAGLSWKKTQQKQWSFIK